MSHKIIDESFIFLLEINWQSPISNAKDFCYHAVFLSFIPMPLVSGMLVTEIGIMFVLEIVIRNEDIDNNGLPVRNA